MPPLEQVKLPKLMEQTSGRREIVIGLIDGPIVMNHPDLAYNSVRNLKEEASGMCTTESTACMHGTFVAGILSANRGCDAPAICPNCTLLVRPIYSEVTLSNSQIPGSTPQELARAIVDCINAGATILNLSSALMYNSPRGEFELEQALDYAAKRRVILVAAAGNQGNLGCTVITRHPWVIPVVAYGVNNRLIDISNLGISIGRRGLGAPGETVTSLGTNGKLLKLSGTSVATPFVTGIIALLCSEFSTLSAAEIKFAVIQSSAGPRNTVVPPLVDAWQAYQMLMSMVVRR